MSQWVSFLRHRGTSAETSPALTLSDFGDTPNITDRSFHLALQMSKQQLLSILNSNYIKLRLNSLLQKKSIMFSHLDFFSFLSFHSFPAAAAGILTAVGSITLLMTCSGTDVFPHIYPSSPTFGAE